MKIDEQKSRYPGDFFKLNRWILTVAGLWEPEHLSKSYRVAYMSYKVCAFVCAYVWYTSSELASLTDVYEDIDATSSTLNIALTHVMGAIKCIFWFVNKNKILALITSLENEEYCYEDIAEFQPSLIWKNAKRVGNISTMAFYTLGAATILSTFVPPIFMTLKIIITGESFEKSSLYRNLPYHCKVPFEYDTPRTYLIVVVTQATLFFTFQHTIVGMDTLFMNLMNCMSSHMDILQGAFRTVKARCFLKYHRNDYLQNELQNSIEFEYAMNQEMKKTIHHLKTIIFVCHELEGLHRFVTLGQVVTTMFVLCSSLLLVSTTEVGSKQFSSYLIYMLAMYWQLIIYCWFGNEVTIKGLEIPNAIWESEWLETSSSYKKTMLITMQRMQRPVQLTIGKFAPLALNSFVSIVKISYSYFAVLKKVRG